MPPLAASKKLCDGRSSAHVNAVAIAPSKGSEGIAGKTVQRDEWLLLRIAGRDIRQLESCHRRACIARIRSEAAASNNSNLRSRSYFTQMRIITQVTAATPSG